MRVLVIAPHGDDEVLGCGATIAKHIDHGDTVRTIVVCAKDVHRYQDLQTQIAQISEVTKYLGIEKTEWLEFPDEQLDRESQSLIKVIETFIFQYKPDTVYVCHPNDMNTDHTAVFNATMIATRPLGKNPPSAVYCYEVLSSTNQYIAQRIPFAPNVYNPVNREHIYKKIKAMSLYKHDFHKFPHCRSFVAIKSLAKLRGSECKSHYAEGFQLVRQVL